MMDREIAMRYKMALESLLAIGKSQPSSTTFGMQVVRICDDALKEKLQPMTPMTPPEPLAYQAADDGSPRKGEY